MHASGLIHHSSLAERPTRWRRHPGRCGRGRRRAAHRRRTARQWGVAASSAHASALARLAECRLGSALAAHAQAAFAQLPQAGAQFARDVARGQPRHQRARRDQHEADPQAAAPGARSRCSRASAAAIRRGRAAIARRESSRVGMRLGLQPPRQRAHAPVPRQRQLLVGPVDAGAVRAPGRHLRPALIGCVQRIAGRAVHVAEHARAAVGARCAADSCRSGRCTVATRPWKAHIRMVTVSAPWRHAGAGIGRYGSMALRLNRLPLDGGEP